MSSAENLLKTINFWIIIELLLIFSGGGTELLLANQINLKYSEYTASFGLIVALAVIALFLFILFRDILKKTITLLSFSCKNLLFLMSVFISIGILFCLIVFLGSIINLVNAKPLSSGLLTINTTIPLLIFAVSTGVTEEVVFRGVIGIYFIEKIKKVPAILILSVLFAIGHIQYSGLLPFITAFVFSICSFYILFITKSLYGSIGFHSGWNFTFSIIDQYFDLKTCIIPFWGNLFELLQIGFLVIILCILLLTYTQRLKSTASVQWI